MASCALLRNAFLLSAKGQRNWSETFSITASRWAGAWKPAAIACTLRWDLFVGGVGPTAAWPPRRETGLTAARPLTPGQAAKSLASAAHPGLPGASVLGRSPARRPAPRCPAAAPRSTLTWWRPAARPPSRIRGERLLAGERYHHYLTVSQFAATFGPSAAAVSAVEASLRASGLTAIR